jgi:PLP dependent protein
VSTLAENFAAIEARILAACTRAGRPRQSVQLIAVSKLQPPQAIREAHALGQRDFGENYPQELRDKHAELGSLPGIRWHAIGPLQTKNARYVARAAHTFHALDRLETAAELSKRRDRAALRCLIQVNVGSEATKAGLASADAPALAQQVRPLPNLQLVGLTCLPPLSENPEDSRPFFRELRALAGTLGVSELSMGTTQDFEVAIEEGATLIRVGTALFGERSPQAK